jgi:hypothetical protein
MALEPLLLEKRKAIKDRWLQVVLETYPADSRRFLKKQKDEFANPVGHTFLTELDNVLGEIIQPSDPGRLEAALDRILRIRAVQDFTPSESLSFLFLLKPIIRAVVEESDPGSDPPPGLEALNTRVDEAVLAAFDVFMSCREKLFMLRADHMKNQVSALLRRAGLTDEVPTWDSAVETGGGDRTLNQT